MDFEQYKKDLLDYFKNNLEDYIDEINLVKTDIAVPYPDLYKIGYPNPQQDTGKVNFYVFKTEYEFEPHSNQSKILKNEITCFVTIKGYSDIDLEKIEERYKEAVFKLFDADMSLGGLSDIAFITKIKSWPGMMEVSNIIPIEIVIESISYMYPSN